MQDWRFDDLTRTLGKATSRRQVLKGLVAGVAAAAVSKMIGPGRAAAAVTCDGQLIAACEAKAQAVYGSQLKVCKSLFGRTGGYQNGGWGAWAGCTISATHIYNQDIASCKSDGGCPNGSCCNNLCLDTSSDHDNCGACGHACNGCQLCQGGHCVDSCGDNAICCNDQCVSTQCDHPKIFDPSQCACVCAFGQECGNTCCTGGQQCCDGTCIDVGSDPNNCGACGNVCPSGVDCVRGHCGCADGKVSCNGTCVDPWTDKQNCGRCGHACRPDEICTYGTCHCPAGQITCTDQCVDLRTDPNNCGRCGHACTDGKQCLDGICRCPDSAVLCNGQCVPTCKDGSQPDPTTCRCTGNCASGEYVCTHGDYGPIANQSTCCFDTDPCCPGNDYFLCGYPDWYPNYQQYPCCPDGTIECGLSCCPNSEICLLDGGALSPGVDPWHCCPPGSGGVLPDGTCCGASQTAVDCDQSGKNPDWHCCENGYDECTCCGQECNP